MAVFELLFSEKPDTNSCRYSTSPPEPGSGSLPAGKAVSGNELVAPGSPEAVRNQASGGGAGTGGV